MVNSQSSKVRFAELDDEVQVANADKISYEPVQEPKKAQNRVLNKSLEFLKNSYGARVNNRPEALNIPD